ncbi:conserved hypothetical protein [Nitrospina gracilis 3/211]|uniref:Nitrile hydratase alpha /Thiocyanate hydrolase gamma domain-containing protein n=1 Tax=Nitrospina gracilis (strain 3/211) TaxID=1266370 RepID=M1Z110_NITG3|nr:MULTISPECIES: hypothetical protein [Nitrospina]MCF8724058.1 hypothetical protein [Nitrospina sp. Nb-3]CCQ91189.1 conserved hypothetical protein [Nitrospina gracilis 3/211]
MKHKRKTELDEKWKQVATQAVTQEEFKQRLVANPVSVMGEFEIHLPEGVEAKVGIEGAVKLFPPDGASEDVLEEVQWWKWRLDMIRQFGREDKYTGVKHTMPESSDEDDV